MGKVMAVKRMPLNTVRHIPGNFRIFSARFCSHVFNSIVLKGHAIIFKDVIFYFSGTAKFFRFTVKECFYDDGKSGS